MYYSCTCVYGQREAPASWSMPRNSSGISQEPEVTNFCYFCLPYKPNPWTTADKASVRSCGGVGPSVRSFLHIQQANASWLQDGATAGQSWIHQQCWDHLWDSRIKKRKKPAQQQLQPERGVQMWEEQLCRHPGQWRMAGGSPGDRAEIPLQPVVQSCGEAAVPWSLWSPWWSRDPSAVQGEPQAGAGGCTQRSLWPCGGQCRSWFTGRTCDPMGDPLRNTLFLKDCSLWWKRPILERSQDSWPHLTKGVSQSIWCLLSNKG